MEAYVTLVATDSYAAGALVLAHRLRDLGSTKDIVCMVTPSISSQVRELLSKVCQLVPVDTLRSKDEANLELLGRPELDITFTKLHLWCLTQYSKIVFLDADTFPLKNIDDLFDRPAFSAAPDAGWPDCFNSGMFVTEPSESTFQDLLKLASEKGSFDGGDQGLLNTYFQWPSSPQHRLPFTYNTTPTSQYGYAPAHNQFTQNIHLLHFIGQNKPWKYQRFSDGKVLPLGNAWEGLQSQVQLWWDTWDKYYGRTIPFHLLSGMSEGFDAKFKTMPITPFEKTTRNAWEDQSVNLEDERRHIQPMPPISSITISQPKWIQQNEVEKLYQEPRMSIPIKQHQEHPKHEESKYSMIEWNPAFQEPPNTGSLGADIPDLSMFRNVWDQPLREQQRVWVAPVHHPEPDILTKPEYSQYNTTDYEPVSLWQDKQDSSQSKHVNAPTFPWDTNPSHFPTPTRVWQDEENARIQHHLVEHYLEEQHNDQQHHENSLCHPSEDYCYQEPQHTEQHHYHEEPYYYHEEHQHNESQGHNGHHHYHEEHQHNESQGHNGHHHYHEEHQHNESQYHYEETYQNESFNHQKNSEREANLNQEVHFDQSQVEYPQAHKDYNDEAPQKDINQDNQISRDQHVEQKSQSEPYHEHSQSELSTTDKSFEEEQIDEYVAAEGQLEEQVQPLFAMDEHMHSSVQDKMEKFIASLIENEDDDDISDRDLIPIRLKSSSRLQQDIYSPSPQGSRASSRANSRSASRRASISRSRRSSVSSQASLDKKLALSLPTSTVVYIDKPVDYHRLEQSHKLFAAGPSASYNMAKTPYTSAAVTPATVSTPEEFPGYEYFGQEQGNLLQEGYIDEPDIFDNSQYSLHQSLVNELHKSEIWDPLEALYKLKQQSENMVLTQSLHEALAKTAKKQQDESLNISKKKNKTFGFKSSWDDEEYELPSALASGQSSPRTPIFRSMATSELSKEIELEKERYKQQRASLMMVKPQTAIASTLEAELDLSQGTIFKKRHLDHQPSFAPAEINTIIKPRNLSSQSVAGPEDETPTGDQFEFYFDERVIEESKKRLKTLLENREEAIPTLNDDMILPTVCTKKQELFQPELGFLNYEHRPFEFDIKSYKSSFAIDKAYKAFKFQPDLVTEECEPDEVLSLRYTTAVSKNPMAKEERSEEKAPEKEAIVKEIEQESLVNASNSNTIDKEEVNVVTAKQTVATDHIIVVEQDNVQLSPEKKMNNSAHATMIDEAINILNEDKQEQAETISHEEKWVRNKAYGLSGFQETTGDQCDILAERGSTDSVLQQQKSIVTNYFGSEVFYAHSTNTKTMTTSPIINRSEITANKSGLDHDPFMSTMKQSPLYTSTTTTSSSTTAVPDKKD